MNLLFIYALLIALNLNMLLFAYTDFKKRIIYNSHVLVFLILVIIWAVFVHPFDYFYPFNLVSILLFNALWFGSFYFAEWQAEKNNVNIGGFGGGDTKILMVMTLIFPPVIYMRIVLVGMVLSLFYFFPFVNRKTAGVPLAVPMTISFLLFSVIWVVF